LTRCRQAAKLSGEYGEPQGSPVATIVLQNEEFADPRWLPPVCLRCGERADLYQAKTFSWSPPWILVFLALTLWGGLILVVPLLIVGLIVTRRRRVRVPLCSAHRWHWFWRNAVAYVGLALILLVSVAGTVAAYIAATQQRFPEEWAAYFCVGSVVAVVAWLFPAALILSGGIRATRIDDDEIRLAGVASKFVHAMELKRDLEEQGLELVEEGT
jgi:hypothetical protein